MSSPVLLCVDDQSELLKHRKAALEHFGYSVQTASSGAAAMRVLEKNSVAAVLLDFKFEGMDAQAVAHQLKQRYPDQPVILLSAYSEMPEAVLWLVDDYVLRSESLERLAQVIERVSTSVGKKKPQPVALVKPHSASA